MFPGIPPVNARNVQPAYDSVQGGRAEKEKEAYLR